jgi:hypothetical protein
MRIDYTVYSIPMQGQYPRHTTTCGLMIVLTYDITTVHTNETNERKHSLLSER